MSSKSEIASMTDTKLAKEIEDDLVAQEVIKRLSGLRAECERVPDDQIGVTPVFPCNKYKT